ncbi:SHOCT domain-containing protein [Aquihabitans sp. McL0605]|uniref:SHOCT domain-containing protein n=1 Tax=Aquihabitans sp. McL0605 TaxID=3415671 RepID=UPI003CFBAF06
MLASEFGTGQVLWSFIWFTMFFIWIWLLIMVFSDIFRSHDMGGWAKFFWIFFVIVAPYLGVFVYLIARGHKMGEHAMEDAKARDEAAQAYIRSTVGASGGASTAEELTKLAGLRDSGVLSAEEFEAQKAKILAS